MTEENNILIITSDIKSQTEWEKSVLKTELDTLDTKVIYFIGENDWMNTDMLYPVKCYTCNASALKVRIDLVFLHRKKDQQIVMMRGFCLEHRYDLHIFHEELRSKMKVEEY